MAVTLLGMVMLVREVHPMNALEFMVVTLLEIDMLVTEVQSLKAES